jgi:Fe-S cluster assembly ATP-binding protein
MGPNGSGKSTLANVLMGHHGYHIIHGEIFFKGVDITPLSPDDRAVLGMFLAFQYPHEIPGVTLFNFLRTASNALNKKRTGQDFEKDKKLAATSLLQFTKKLKQQMTLLEIDEGFAKRYVNEGFSGGEKKRAEVLQMSMLEPQLAIMDETDSGLDIDALKIVSKGVNTLISPDRSILLITHYQRLLNYIKPQFVHILIDGKIVTSNGPELAYKLEEKGYDWVREQIETAI